MNARLSAFLGTAVLAAVIFGSPAPHAQLNFNPFSQYYENVARAAKQNDAGLVKSPRQWQPSGPD